MRYLALVAALAANAAQAQPYPSALLEPDEFTLERESDTLAIVEYYNSASRSSAHFPRELTNGDLTVGLHLDIGNGPEVLTVTPPDGWIAIPPSISVVDGETGVIELRRGEYLGF